MTEADWLNEVELNRPESGDLIFAHDTIEAMFDDRAYGYADRDGNFTDIVGRDYIFEEPDPLEKLSFYHGTDWAKERDFTIIHSMLEVPNGADRLAAWAMHQKEPYPNMFGYHNKRIKDYGGASFFDGTGGIGEVSADYMDVDSEAWDFRAIKQTHEMYTSYVVACESMQYIYPNIPYLKKAHSRLTRGQLYQSAAKSRKFHTPDPIAAAALSHKAKMEGVFQLLLGRA